MYISQEKTARAPKTRLSKFQLSQSRFFDALLLTLEYLLGRTQLRGQSLFKPIDFRLIGTLLGVVGGGETQVGKPYIR